MQKIDLNNKTILVTGHAGFIGSNLVHRLFSEMSCGTIVGVDNLNSYYDPTLKIYRLDELDKTKPAEINYQSIRGDISDKTLIDKLFAKHKFDIVVNLAAQAGVRYSIENPDAYIQSNMIGFYNILEACRHNPVEHLVYASSSSVYGGNKKVPFSTDDRVDNPVSLYAATKKSNELFAHCYSKLYDIEYTDCKGETCKIKRNGCIGCATDILYRDNHLAALRKTHPNLHAALMKYGMADELKKLYATRSNGIPSIIDVFDDTERLLNVRPCAFDDIGSKLDHEGIDEEYEEET